MRTPVRDFGGTPAYRVISFFVRGAAKPTQTGSVMRVKQKEGKDRLIPMRRGTAWSAKCALAAEEHAPPQPLEGPLEVRLHFYLPKPKSGKASKRKYPSVKPDVENLGKGILDSWNSVLYADDSQVVSLLQEKDYVGKGMMVGVDVWIRELEAVS